MADAVRSPGRLVAIDGSRGADVARAADALAERLRERGVICGISRWDASGIFNELALAGREEHGISPRTLTLAYVADLAFRLQWEIRPALAAGGIVIAAPYLETPVALGIAYGLPEAWLRDVLRFAPPPNARGLAEERKTKRGWRRRPDRGYAEYCASLLDVSDADFGAKGIRKSAMAALKERGGRKVWSLTARGIVKAAKAIIGSPPAAPARSVSHPRTARR